VMASMHPIAAKRKKTTKIQIKGISNINKNTYDKNQFFAIKHIQRSTNIVVFCYLFNGSIFKRKNR